MTANSQILRRLSYTVIFFVSFHISKGQFTDDFTDGDFTSNPAWSGSSIDFIINSSKQLQVTNSLAQGGASYLSAAFTAASIDNFEWQIYVRQTFSGSTTNYGRVYLVSDQADLTQSLNGYYLQFGEALSNDAVELFKQTGITSTSICRATNGAIASSFAIRVKVLRDNTGLWKLLIDYSGNLDFIEEASGTDATYTTSSYLGVACVYTASNYNKFFYDDFYMGPVIVDLTPPQINLITVNSSTEIDVLFNEKLDASTSQDINNFVVNNTIGKPMSAILQADQKTVRLNFATEFPNAINSLLSVSGVKDLVGNAIISAEKEFFYFQPVAAIGKDIIITEIFADPSPSVGLPEVEFIEIYNRSDKVFNLQNWKISDGSSNGTIPSHFMYPDEYVILVLTSSVTQFNVFGTALGVTNFPTLNNSGDALTLKDNNNIDIDFVHYLDTWYRDDDKKQGGFTLELIDPSNPCGEEDNWISSEATIGGTPGIQNSVFASKPDLTGPKLISATPISSTKLSLNFNERLSSELPSATSFTISPDISVTAVSFKDASLRILQLTIASNLQAGVQYSLTVSQDLSDCNGNSLQTNFNSVYFGLPEAAEAGDIVINEILFNPRPTGVDFVEVYNNSSKFINLKNYSISNIENEIVINARKITGEDFLLSPGRYIVFTENSNVVKGQYIAAIEENLFQVVDLPSFNDSEGSVALIDSLNNVIDYFLYDEDYHTVFIKDNEGVSLERISFSEDTNNVSNWKSASSTSGFATPGYINSNSRNEISTGKIVVDPEVFDPVSGIPSFTQIQYNFDKGGFVANIKVFDFQGREIKQIANNATLGTSGFFRWDGDTNDGSKARSGYYIVWAEVFNANGTVQTFRKRVVVSSKF